MEHTPTPEFHYICSSAATSSNTSTLLLSLEAEDRLRFSETQEKGKTSFSYLFDPPRMENEILRVSQ